jgi:hypothetical protein
MRLVAPTAGCRGGAFGEPLSVEGTLWEGEPDGVGFACGVPILSWAPGKTKGRVVGGLGS